MGLNSVLANALNAINNAEKRGKRQVLIRPASKVTIKFLSVMMSKGKFHFSKYFDSNNITIYLFIAGYIGEFEVVDDHRAGKIVVNLTGRLIKCGVISPRFDANIQSIEKWTNNLLPSRQFG